MRGRGVGEGGGEETLRRKGKTGIMQGRGGLGREKRRKDEGRRRSRQTRRGRGNKVRYYRL